MITDKDREAIKLAELKRERKNKKRLNDYLNSIMNSYKPELRKEFFDRHKKSFEEASR